MSSSQLLSQPESNQDFSSIVESAAAIGLLTPKAQSQMQVLKRKISDLSNQGSPQSATKFLRWRTTMINNEIKTLNVLMDDFRPSQTKDRRLNPLCDQVTKKIDDLERELKVLLTQDKFLSEDISDSVESAEKAYVESLYAAFRACSEDGLREKKKTKQEKPMDRKSFRKLVGEYLGTAEPDEGILDKAYCCVLGIWFPKALVKCAHIVPHSFNSKELEYMFGVGDAALHSPRNGIYMYSTIEGGFDNGWIAIVPHDDVEATPTEWKIVLLNEAIGSDMVVQAKHPMTEIKRWKVSAIHKRSEKIIEKLTHTIRILMMSD